MQFRHFFIVIFFWLLALAQSSFLAHYNILGVSPNMVFIFFIILIFFSYFKKPDFSYQDLFYSIIAGIFLDIYSSLYFGASVVFLTVIGFFIKKLMKLLREESGKYPTIYFLSIFSVSFLAYKFFSGIDFYFFIELAYNIAFALLGFLACKIIAGFSKNLR